MKPELSAVLVTLTDFEVLRKSISHLQNQTAKDRLELVIVCLSRQLLEPHDAMLSQFPIVQIVELNHFTSSGSALREGMLKARAPIVAYVEDHSFPSANWAETLINTHSGEWAAVGWSLTNANPESLISWAFLFTNFAPWVERSDSGEMDLLSPHHTSYKKDRLVEFGSELGSLLESENILHRLLRDEGHRLYFDAKTQSAHLNITKITSFVVSRYLGGRLYGAQRAQWEQWGVAKKLFHILAAPLVPLLLIYRLAGQVRRAGRADQLFPGILVYFAIGSVVHALSELIGYVIGPGNVASRRANYELDRYKHISA